MNVLSRRQVFAGLIALGFLATGISAVAANKQLRNLTPPGVAKLAPLGRLDGTQQLNLAIGLPVHNQAALTEFLRELGDPSSANYRHYLTPAQFTAQYGPTEADYAAVVAFAKAKGLTVTNTHSNRLLLDVQGSASTVEAAFNVKMMSYQHPTEARKFYAPDAPPTVAADLPILVINGLSNYSLPQPHFKILNKDIQAAGNGGAATGTATALLTGTGPGGNFMGKDFRNAYAPNVSLTGTGQTVGLVQFDGYTMSDITYYESHAGLPNVPLTNILLDSFTGTETGNGNEVEVSLDIEMAASMAPNLSGILVYEAGPDGIFDDVLNRMAMDNLASQLSCSWFIQGGVSDPSADLIFEEMSAQGQSFFAASGDNDAFTGLIPFPDDSPYITVVGGTLLTMNGSGASYNSETAWNRNNGIGSGGGISTQYSIPTWQQGVSMATNQGSTTMRNIPDVALTADNIYVRVDGKNESVGGTSCAAPLWGGFMALVNQQSKINTGLSVGFVNPAVYSFGLSSTYTSDFHDTTVGNDFSTSSPTKFAAVTGYDLATGWGTPTGSAMIVALAGSTQPKITTTSPLPTGTTTIAYTDTFTATSGTTPYVWTLASGSLPGGLNLSTAGVLSGTPSSSGTSTFAVQVAGGRFSSTGTFSLTIVQALTPPVITNGPPPATGTVNMPYNFVYSATGYPSPAFSVSAGALPNGLSLSSTGTITGPPTLAGVFTGTVTASNGVNPAAMQSFSITIYNTYTSWAAQYFTALQMTEPAVSGPNATPDNDGLLNLLKFVYDINPTETLTAADMAALPVGSFVTVSGQKYLCLTYRENALLTGVTVSLQSSPDLLNWTMVTPDLSQQVGTDAGTGDPIVQVGVNVTGLSQEFLRLSVTSP